MTLLDQAVFKAFQRRDNPLINAPSVTSSIVTTELEETNAVTGDSARRELYLHAPETRLRGMHKHGGSSNNVGARPVGPKYSLDDVAGIGEPEALNSDESDEIIAHPEPMPETVMNGLLSYELSIQASIDPGPISEHWHNSDASTWPQADPGMRVAETVPLADRNRAEPEVTDESRSPIKTPFKPAWETDGFRTNELCQDIQRRLSESIRSAADQLMGDCAGGRRLIHVAGTKRGVGTTTVAILLARALANANLRVILVDGDLKNAGLADQLGVAVDGGWNVSSIDQSAISESSVFSIGDQFTFLPLEALDRADIEATQKAMPDILELLSLHFDVVLVDVGNDPSGHDQGSRGFIGAHVVVNDGRSEDREDLARLVEALSAPEETPIRIVENFSQSQGQ